MNINNIYQNSPIFIQNLMTTLQGYIYAIQRFGRGYREAKDEYESLSKSEYLTIENYQELRLQELIKYAYKKSPFYKEYYKHIDIEKIKTLDDLKKLPVLEKELVRSHIENLYTISKKHAIISNTSGTTGKSMIFRYTKNDFQRRMAYLDFFKAEHGFHHRQMRRASFSSSKIIPKNQTSRIYWRNNYAMKQRLYSGYHCQGDNLKVYVENLQKYMPHSLDGYPSSIYLIARYIIDNNIRLNFHPVGIFPTAEKLLPHYKNTIEEAFGCGVYDQYASSEGAPFITECSYGKLHYCMHTGVIETDTEDNMIITCFETHGTPLIRYKIGDFAVFDLANKKCECGSNLPIIKQFEGRNHDYLVGKSGIKQPMLYFSLVSEEFNSSIIQMQFRQNIIGIIELYIVVDAKYDKNKMNKILEDKLHYSLGNDTKVNIHIVDFIEKDLSGKTRLILNNL